MQPSRKRLSLPRLPTMSDNQQSSSKKPTLRWLGGWNNTSLSDSPPSPASSALAEALNDDILPNPPPPARLPSAFYASHSLSRPPPFFDNLARSTLPTASVSKLLFSADSHLLESPPIVLTHSPPTRSSIDSLRSVQSRAIHTSAMTQASPTQPTNWWWSSHKENVDSLLTDEDRGDTVEQEQDSIRKKYRAPHNPVVFCHGLLGFDSVTIGPSIAHMQVSHWRGITEVLEANGIQVLITRVPATSSPVDRAKVLEAKINEVYPGRSVHLIGHSMGGLDCRYMTTHLTQRKFRVLSITTIATPHRGSSFADHFLATIGHARMPSVISLLDLLPNGGGDGKAFESLTIASMEKFNQETPDVPGVRYLSWGAVYEPGLIDTWKWPHSVILEKEGPNDGLVSVESSKWGTYLGTLSDVNHLDLVGWINTARYKWAQMMGNEIKFRPATFYLGICDYLAWEVEGQKEVEQETRAHSTPGGSGRSSAVRKGGNDMIGVAGNGKKTNTGEEREILRMRESLVFGTENRGSHGTMDLDTDTDIDGKPPSKSATSRQPRNSSVPISGSKPLS